MAVWVGAVAGCSRPGDFGEFLIHQITGLGGRTNLNAQLPKLDARWVVREDRNGFQVLAADTSFHHVDAFLRQAFGAPKLSGFSTNIGQAHATWAAVDIGVAVMVIGGPDGVEVTCVRGLSSVSEMNDEVSKPWWRKLW